MCQECVSLGSMTQQEFDEARAAGDRSVIPYNERVQAGESVFELLAELEPWAAVLGYASPAEMIDATAKARAARSD